MAKIHSRAFDARLEELEAIRSFSETATRDLGLNERAIDELKVCVDEAATNIVNYGYGDGIGELSIEISREANEIVVKIRDRGIPFDPDTVPAPNLDVPLNVRPVGGMGVHLIRTMTDGMSHSPRPGGGNEMVLRKRIR